jgi:hypothetical protein
MAQMDLFHNINPGIAIPFANYQDDIVLDDALTVDTLGYESVTFIIFPESQAGTGTFTITVYESDTNVDEDFVQVSNSAAATPLLIKLLGVTNINGVGDAIQFEGDEDYDAMLKFAYIGKKRYLRLVLDAADTPNFDFGVMALLGNPLSAPTPDIPESVNPV